MTRRSGDWGLVGHGQDPVPASAWDVWQAAQRFTDRATDLDDAHRALSRLARLDGWSGHAAETFAEESQDVLEDLATARDKYDDAGDALVTFKSAVQTARDTSWQALQNAEAAQAQMRANRADPLSGILEATPEQVLDAQQESGRHADATSALSAARAQLAEAMSTLDEAARSCADRIGRASEKMGDSLWADLKGAIRDIADILVAICDVLEWVALALAAVGLAIALFATAPIWGTIALVLLIAGAVVGGVLLLSRLALVVSESGEATWADVAWDAVGLVAAVVGGRATLRAARQVPAAISGAADASRALADDVARAALPTNTRNALHISNPANNLRAWAQTSWDDLARPGRASVEAAQRTLAPWSSRLSNLDAGAAHSLARIRELRLLSPEHGRVLLDAAARTQMDAVRLGQLNTALSADALVGKLFEQVGDVQTGVRDGLVQTAENLHWRLTEAGR